MSDNPLYNAEAIRALVTGDKIRLLPDIEEGFPAIDVTFVEAEWEYEVMVVETPEHGIFEVGFEQFDCKL